MFQVLIWWPCQFCTHSDESTLGTGAWAWIIVSLYTVAYGLLNLQALMVRPADVVGDRQYTPKGTIRKIPGFDFGSFPRVAKTTKALELSTSPL